MAEITAALVKELRERTGAGMMDCKKALTESGGDLEQARDWLRKKGLAQAAKKAGRTATEGLIGVAVAGPVGAMVEVNSETDFVARNESFQAFVSTVTTLALAGDGTLEGLLEASYPDTGRTVADETKHLVGTIGENIQVRRVGRLTVNEGAIGSYIHNLVAPGMGKIGVIAALDSAGDTAALEVFGRQLCMHIAAARPEVVSIDRVDPAALERERAVLADQARASGKPENIIEKMVEGRLRKYYEEVVLLEQLYVIDGESRVKAVVESEGKTLGSPVAVTEFVRFALGEGIEKEDKDFASEVAAAAGGD
ncbi:MAG: elongation factor Ts [Alphaproteobacteria bacterium]|jgi:elongation factor Ts|nr:elongation factor Ts [Alphaproteobacteria bacterium]